MADKELGRPSKVNKTVDMRKSNATKAVTTCQLFRPQRDVRAKTDSAVDRPSVTFGVPMDTCRSHCLLG